MHERGRLFWILLSGVGLLFGIVTSRANAMPEWNVLSKLIGIGWPWAAVGIAAAAIAERHRWRAAVVVLLAAVLGYYGSDLAVGVYATLDFDDPATLTDPSHAERLIDWSSAVSDALYWSAVAAAVSWPLSLIGGAVHRADLMGLLARLVIPAGAVLECALLRLPDELAIQPNPVTVATYAVVTVSAVIGSAVLVGRHLR